MSDHSATVGYAIVSHRDLDEQVWTPSLRHLAAPSGLSEPLSWSAPRMTAPATSSFRPFPIIATACLLWLCGMTAHVSAQTAIPIAEGWARTKVNCVIFRKNALCSAGEKQYASFYDPDGRMTLAQRTHGESRWTLATTPYQGRVADAHNCISIAVDGDGYLHVCWDHHGQPLRYARSLAPGSLELSGKLPMIGRNEDRVTYPEFYQIPGGDLLFFYRDGASGNGNLVLNRYDTRLGVWSRVQKNLLDGEGQRNAYWQVAIGRRGEIHLSWVWRETGDVRTNHDLAYARSMDGGVTWTTIAGRLLSLPITESTADYAVRIPQDSELANQTSMAVDDQGHPYIATFWRDLPQNVPQYRIVFHDGRAWKIAQVGERTLNFHRVGGGTKRPPVSRPVVLIRSANASPELLVVFRDAERGGGMSLARCQDLAANQWTFTSLTTESVGQADPLIDPTRWASHREIHLLTQFVGQGDGEREEDVPPQMIRVVEWKPN